MNKMRIPQRKSFDKAMHNERERERKSGKHFDKY